MSSLASAPSFYNTMNADDSGLTGVVNPAAPQQGLLSQILMNGTANPLGAAQQAGAIAGLPPNGPGPTPGAQPPGQLMPGQLPPAGPTQGISPPGAARSWRLSAGIAGGSHCG